MMYSQTFYVLKYYVYKHIKCDIIILHSTTQSNHMKIEVPPMQTFIDRIPEMKTLEKEYAKNESSLVIVYGRRRVGKTTLLTEFIRNKHAIYFLATQEQEAINRAAFKDKVTVFTHNELLAEVTVDKWDTLFQAIVSNRSTQKSIIIIDEFQYLGKTNPAFPSIIQRIWDEILKNSNIMLILCGSLIPMMVSQTLAYNSPLYGRRTVHIRLKQIPFIYYKEFYKGQPLKALIERYSVTGGIPKYIESFTDCKDILTGIEENVLNQSNYLYEEPQFLLQQEVSEIGGYFSILRAIAFGNHRLSDISSVLELKATDLTRPLKTLMELDLVKREIPITEKNPEKSKKGLYKITDNFILFWFTFVYPNLSDIEQGNTPYVLDKIKKSFVRNHVAFVYEDICRETLAQNEQIPYHFSKVGRYWDKHTEIDVVAINEDENTILFGECKYWNKDVSTDVFYSLINNANKVTWSDSTRKEIFVIYSVNGFSPELIALAKEREDLYLCE